VSGSNPLDLGKYLADPNNLLSLGDPQLANASKANLQAIQDWVSQQRQISEQRGLWGPQGITGAGVQDAAQQYGNALVMGTTAPGESALPAGYSLEKVQRRRSAPPNEHIWTIKDPAGGSAGTIDTTWNPDTGNLHIEDFQSEGGPNTFGTAAIRQLRGALLDQYPGVKTLTGLRISGATYAHKNSGSGPGRPAIQTINPSQYTSDPAL